MYQTECCNKEENLEHKGGDLYVCKVCKTQHIIMTAEPLKGVGSVGGNACSSASLN